jgi:Fic family protein
MSTVIRRRWVSDHTGLSRRDRRGCAYEAYVPDSLVGRAFAIEGEVAADIADAEAAITRLNLEATSLVATDALARMLLRAESVASSRIEGLEIGARRLLRAEAARDLRDEPRDVTAVEVLGNIDAMAYAVEQVRPGGQITTELILGVHQRLLADTRLEQYGGRFREQQNWIGGSDHNPCSAAFVPPPPEHVTGLIADLVAFSNDEALPAVAQAAIAHAQFETIHPFVDGNGRTGRALIHLILRRRGLAPRVLPPVSLILATWSQDYIDALTAYRYRGPATSRQASDGVNLWIGRFATACRRAAEDASSFERQARDIEAKWRERLGRVRAGSSTDILLRLLVGAPVVSVRSAANLIGRSFVHTNEAVARLVEAGVLQQVTVGRRNRAFEALDIIAAFTDLERQLASPEGENHASGNARRMPQRLGEER